MKKLLPFLAIGLLPYTGTAQQRPVLQKSNFQLKTGPFHYHVAMSSGFHVPKADSAQAWNYSTLTDVADTQIRYRTNPYSQFNASAEAVADIGRTEKITSNGSVTTNIIYDEDTTGLFEAGRYIPAQKYSLANYFGEPADSLYIPEQSDYCRINQMEFPAMSGTAFTQKIKRTLKFNISVKTVGYKKAPGTKVTQYTTYDTVAGWGSIRIPAANKYSTPYPVILVKQKTETIDSYAMAKPANPVFWNALGIKQGEKISVYTEYFYRSGFYNPLMTINFGADSTYTHPVSVYYTADSIKSNISLYPTEISDMTIFPNPVSSSTAFCRFAKNSPAAWKLMVTNMYGQVLAEQNVNGAGMISFPIPLKNMKNNGMCLVTILNETGAPLHTEMLHVIRP